MENRLLVDGNYLLHKNFHTFKNFKVGELFTGTTYGLLRDVHKYASAHNTKHVVVTWDARSFRKDLASEYKSQRSIDTTKLHPYSSVELVHESCTAFGFEQYKVDGYESDDLLYTLSRDATYNDTVLSSDEDLLSCLSESTSVYLVRKKQLFTTSNFENTYGFPFSENSYVTYKCLVGDKSDNVRGVPRIKKSTVYEALRNPHHEVLVQNEELLNKNRELFKLRYVSELVVRPGTYSEHGVQEVLRKTRIKSLGAVVSYFSN